MARRDDCNPDGPALRGRKVLPFGATATLPYLVPMTHAALTTACASKRDELFVDKVAEIGGFNFGEKTAEVFDDMLDRSIPLYPELQRMLGEIAGEFARPGTTVYDLGCSTGITLRTLMEALPDPHRFVGIDYSPAMLDRARNNLVVQPGHTLELRNADLNEPAAYPDASVSVVNLVLQFVRPLRREALVKSLYDGLCDGGCLLLVEKTLGNDALLNKTFIKLYYDLKKRNGYSQMEISKKREELENVLIPYTLDENAELLRSAGFAHVDVFFKWHNFAGLIAIK